MGRHFGYARVSTLETDPGPQLAALAAAGCGRIFRDDVTAAQARRPELERALRAVRAGDTLVVWRLDRLGRNLRHLSEVLTELDERGVGLRALTEDVDTASAGSGLVAHLCAALAAFEHGLIVERTRAGMAAARDRGHSGGRPSTMTPARIQAAQEMYESGRYTVQAIADNLGVSRPTVYKHLDRAAR
ncbi:MAG: recombinase family protein [Jatrophihabitans sp.]